MKFNKLSSHKLIEAVDDWLGRKDSSLELPASWTQEFQGHDFWESTFFLELAFWWSRCLWVTQTPRSNPSPMLSEGTPINPSVHQAKSWVGGILCRGENLIISVLSGVRRYLVISPQKKYLNGYLLQGHWLQVTPTLKTNDLELNNSQDSTLAIEATLSTPQLPRVRNTLTGHQRPQKHAHHYSTFSLMVLI